MSTSIFLNKPDNKTNVNISSSPSKCGVIILDDNKNFIDSIICGIENLEKESFVIKIGPNDNIDSKISQLQAEGINLVTICTKRKFSSKFIYFGFIQRLIRKLLKKSFIIIPNEVLLGKNVIPKGLLTKNKPSDTDLLDIARGVYIANILNKIDLGESLIVRNKKVVIIQTDIMDNKDVLFDYKGLDLKGGVLIILTKYYQKNKLIFPVIDAKIVLSAVSAKLHGIVLSANYSRFEPNAKKIADRKKLFILGV